MNYTVRIIKKNQKIFFKKSKLNSMIIEIKKKNPHNHNGKKKTNFKN